MKLKDWAEKQGISYLTAWRWFKAKDPRFVNAYQSDSGTIIVPEDSDILESSMITPQSNDVMSIVLKKTVELSKNNASIEDFAAWILSNFNLKPNIVNETPRYSRTKPKSEEVQKHFQQFLKPKGEKPKTNMFLTSDPEALNNLVSRSDELTKQELVAEINKIGEAEGVSVNPNDTPEVQELYKNLSLIISEPYNHSEINVKTYDDITEGVVARSIDLTQQLNYTNSAKLNDHAFSNVYLPLHNTSCVSQNSFKPTNKELESLNKASLIIDKPRRGRKKSKITRNE
jgi:hypothetical protein